LYFRYLTAYVNGPQGAPLVPDTVQLHISGLIITTNHPDMQKIRIIGFFFENNLHWRFKFRLLLFTV